LSQADLTIRALRAGDDLDADRDLLHRAFGPMPVAEPGDLLGERLDCIAQSRLFGAWDGKDQVGTARFHDMRQWWYGRSVPMAGVGGVAVAPEARGRGIGKALMTALLGAMAERGYPISVLYPATTRLYRSLGWELAGGYYRAELPGRSLSSLLPADPAAAAPRDAGGGSAGAAGVGAGDAGVRGSGSPALRRVCHADADEIIAVLGTIYAGGMDCGPCTTDPASVRRWLLGRETFAYLAPDGFLAYSWHGSSHEIMVHVLQAASAGTVSALWGIVGSHAALAKRVRACVGPSDPITWLTREPDVSLSRNETWMLRLLDARAAIEGRGFPADARVRLALALTDPQLPANAGLHTLTVADGAGSLIRSETGSTAQSPAAPPVRLGPRGFAALFAGVPMATLRRAGLAAGGDGTADAALDCAFAAQPYLLDYF
jgi:predicted N-acetyltransferase YhbS